MGSSSGQRFSACFRSSVHAKGGKGGRVTISNLWKGQYENRRSEGRGGERLFKRRRGEITLPLGVCGCTWGGFRMETYQRCPREMAYIRGEEKLKIELRSISSAIS